MDNAQYGYSSADNTGKIKKNHIFHLGTIKIKSKEVDGNSAPLDWTQLDTIDIKNTTIFLDQAYDNFSLSVENIQMLVALANENWREELEKEASPMFILSPTSIQVTLEVSKFGKKDPELPLCKINGKLNQISVNISGEEIKSFKWESQKNKVHFQD